MSDAAKMASRGVRLALLLLVLIVRFSLVSVRNC
jgi:hypothetical protein